MSSRSMRAGAIAVAAVMMSSMVACSGPSASEKASASFHNSVSAARDALFEEAKVTNQGFFDLDESLGLAGGVTELPAEMDQYVMGNARGYVENLLQMVHRDHERTAPNTKAILIGPAVYDGPKMPALAEADARAEIVIERCIDARQSPQLNAQGNPIEGSDNVLHQILFLDHDKDGKLKIFETTSGKVDSCPLAA
ncbi:hypothetical protein [Propionibacterium freudenreichii]|uniref:hypothetical protein n=1 Tax=Propionibacterium freudenreichii TaxID=1744 RepID=UPI0009C0E4F5|nr:hypothetical protein [Propionibacterium freudenreichii]MDK9301034.1 hypothetical protein [Propionibacterium freudenreichii]MDK9320693.1 hypothetical protein [Propionibacterium freudenreichii]MDK9324507.1 hypothetical protein [Propionibacterium freudenreichii]MDK9339356.1 hypothetical protein [Propionibacterium freudenreichii]MDK9644308.1 hypothetical protein [Propionibacterium freudenreichii]